MVLITKMSLHVSTCVYFHKSPAKQGRAISPLQKEEKALVWGKVLKTWHGYLAGKCLLRFHSLNFSDTRVNLMHNHHKLLEATLTSYLVLWFFVCLFF